MLIIYDANGYSWTLDILHQRLYCIESEGELNPDEKEYNGFYCESWEKAVVMLNQEGFMEK